MKNSLILFLIILLGYSSVLAQPAINSDIEEPEEVLSALMMTCYVCHNPRVKSHDDIIAPPLVGVKHMWKMKYPEKKEFTNQMMDFVNEPTNKKAIMMGAVMKFGVMPQMPLDEEQVSRIVNYIYDNEIEEPIWFPEHFEAKHGIKWEGQ